MAWKDTVFPLIDKIEHGGATKATFNMLRTVVGNMSNAVEEDREDSTCNFECAHPGEFWVDKEGRVSGGCATMYLLLSRDRVSTGRLGLPESEWKAVKWYIGSRDPYRINMDGPWHGAGVSVLWPSCFNHLELIGVMQKPDENWVLRDVEYTDEPVEG